MTKLFSPALALAISTCASLSSGAAMAETYNITAVAGHPPVFAWVKHIEQTFVPALEAALAESGDTAAWSIQVGGSLANVGEELETIEEGLAEIGVVNTIFDSSKMAEQNVTFFTPFLSSDPRLIGDTLNQMQFDLSEMQRAWGENGLVYLGGASPVGDYLLFTKDPITSLADLDGLKIGAGGPAVNWFDGTGAIGVSGNLTTYYNELKTGVYDGVIIFATAGFAGKLYEVAPNITQVGFGAQYPGGLAANADWFEGLPEHVQTALLGAAEVYREEYMLELEATTAGAVESMIEAGAIYTELSGEQKAEWANGMQNIAQNWATTLDGNGRDGTVVLEAYMNAMRDAGAVPARNWDQE